MTQFSRNPDWDILLDHGQARESAFAALLGEGATIEHKSEPRAIEFGSVFVELSDDAQGPTGLSVTKADWHAIEFAPERWIVLRTDELRQLTEEVRDSYGLTRGGWEKRSVGVKLPLVRLIARQLP